MTDWDGRGLPPAARDRLARFGAGGARTSLLPVAGAAGIESVGLSPVGEVMGCIVQNIGWSGWGGCGYYGGFGGRLGGFGAVTQTSGSSSYAGYAPYVDAMYRGYDTAMSRLLEEARGLGADGVVGIRLTVEHLGNGNREFVALGTAVRAHARTRPPVPFTTELAGQDVAKLMHAGWLPVGVAYGISVAIRHDDWATRQQRGWGAGNVEVVGYTELVTHVRADARHQLERRTARFGAEGCVGTRLTMHIWEREPSDNHIDHVAEAVVMGSAVVRFGGRRARREPAAGALSVLPLRPASQRSVRSEGTWQ